MNDEDAALHNEQKRALRVLIQSEGWRILAETLKEQCGNRESHIVLTPLSETFTSHMQEYMKGEAAILRLILTLPERILESLEDDKDVNAEQQYDPDQPDTGEQQLGPDGWAG